LEAEMIDFTLGASVEQAAPGASNAQSGGAPAGGAFDEMLARSLGRGVVKGYTPATPNGENVVAGDGDAAGDGMNNSTSATAALTTLVGTAPVESASPSLISNSNRLVAETATPAPGVERPIDKPGLPTPLAAGVTLTSKRRASGDAVRVAKAPVPMVETGDAALRIPVVSSPADPLVAFAVTDVAGTSGTGSVAWDVKVSIEEQSTASDGPELANGLIATADPASPVDRAVQRPVKKIGLPPPPNEPPLATPVTETPIAVDIGAVDPVAVGSAVVVDVRDPVRSIPEQPNTALPQAVGPPADQNRSDVPTQTTSMGIPNGEWAGTQSPPGRSLPTPPGGSDGRSTDPTGPANLFVRQEAARVERSGAADRPVRSRPIVGPLAQNTGTPIDLSQAVPPQSSAATDIAATATPAVPGSVAAATVDRIMEAVEVQRAAPNADAVLVDIPEMDGLQLRVALRGTEVAITRTSLQGSTEHIRPMLIELGSALANKGFSLAGEGRGGDRNRQPQRPYVAESDQRHQRRRSANRRGVQL
jgi:hypothetical protein